MINIAIDGPSGSGKSTISKILSKKMNFLNVDTGALYRAIGYFFYVNKLKYEENSNLREILKNIKIEIKNQEHKQKIILNGEDITDNIRSTEISKIASEIARLAPVREFLVKIQRDIAYANNTVMDGRDIGTVILPNADIKFFLTASAKSRAYRRYLQLNKSESYNKIFESILERDKNDMSRKLSPLKPASDAIIFDNSDYTLEETVEKLLNIIKERFKIETK